MVTEIFNDQLKWFTEKLLELRACEDGFHTNIDFDPSNITNSAVPSFDTTSKTPQVHITRMLTEIRGALLKKGVTSPVELLENIW